MTKSNLPPIKRILEDEMRERFNRIDFATKLRAGGLIERLLDDRHPSLPAANEPHCTRSQMISYRDRDGNEVARVHQYVRPDKTIGASGRPDPKRVFENGILYRLVQRRHREPAQGEAKAEAPED
jgi:hypothetical protein